MPTNDITSKSNARRQQVQTQFAIATPLASRTDLGVSESYGSLPTMHVNTRPAEMVPRLVSAAAS